MKHARAEELLNAVTVFLVCCLVAVSAVECALPDINKVDLDGCIRECSDSGAACLSIAGMTGDACADQLHADLKSCIDYVNSLPWEQQRDAEEQCALAFSSRAATCSHAEVASITVCSKNEVGCFADCVYEAEVVLGKKPR